MCVPFLVELNLAKLSCATVYIFTWCIVQELNVHQLALSSFLRITFMEFFVDFSVSTKLCNKVSKSFGKQGPGAIKHQSHKMLPAALPCQSFSLSKHEDDKHDDDDQWSLTITIIKNAITKY